jgi:hypothetical protein
VFHVLLSTSDNVVKVWTARWTLRSLRMGDPVLVDVWEMIALQGRVIFLVRSVCRIDCAYVAACKIQRCARRRRTRAPLVTFITPSGRTLMGVVCGPAQGGLVRVDANRGHVVRPRSHYFFVPEENVFHTVSQGR